MRDFDAAQEQRFFDIFKKYYDLEKDAGKHFDPQLAKVFLDHREEFEKSRKAS